jgi:hypothetical protein
MTYPLSGVFHPPRADGFGEETRSYEILKEMIGTAYVVAYSALAAAWVPGNGDNENSDKSASYPALT